MVLEFEQREATHRATANAVLTSPDGQQPQLPDPSGRQPKPKPKAKAKAAPDQGVLTTHPGKSQKICFHFRDHGNCPKGDAYPFSHDN